jgi:LPXTG-motif cell wall-anchored protein
VSESGDPSLPSTGGNPSTLPKTGAPSGVLALLGAGLLGIGGITLMAGRRRPATVKADSAGI